MKTLIISLASGLFSILGYTLVDRAISKMDTEITPICYGQIEYLLTPSGVVPSYLPDGKIKQCLENSR